MPALSAPTTRPLRRHLMTLVVVAVVPVLVFAVIMVIVFDREERASTARGLRDTTRALALAVDRELETSIKALEALAGSVDLDAGDLPHFARHVARVMPTQPWWRAIFLTDPQGDVIQSTTPGRRVGADAFLGAWPHFREMTRTLRPAFSDLIVDPTSGAPTMTIVVPVVRDGRLRYALGATLNLGALSQFLAAQSLPAEWTGTILDRSGLVLARSRAAEPWFGRQGGGLLSSLPAESGWVRGPDVEGVTSYAAYSRSNFSGWTVAITMPAAVIDAPLRHSLSLAIGGGLALLLGGAALAAFVGRRVSRPILGLVEAAEALGRGQVPSQASSSVDEVNRLASAIESAGRERQRFERALRDSEAQLRAIFSSTLDAIVVADDDGRYVDANPAAEELFGMAREDLLGRRAHDFTLGTDVDALWRDFREKGSARGTFVIARPDGGVRDVEFAATANVLPGRHVSVLRDVTARRQAEEDLRRTEREATAVADVTRRINEHLELDAILEHVCESARTLCGADAATIALAEPDEPGVMRLRLRMPASAAKVAGDVIERGKGVGGLVMETGRPFRSADYEADDRITRDYVALGRRLRTRAVMVVPIGVADEIAGLLYVANETPRPFSDADETVLVRLADQAASAIRNAQLLATAQGARAEAEAANRTKDDFLATLSHELRTPLTSMLGWVRMLRTARLGPEQTTRALETIERNTRWQAKLIDDLLDVSRIVAGKMQVERQAVDVVAVVAGALEALRGDTEGKGLTLETELDPATGTVLGDPVRLAQVVANLVSNAVKFTPAGGRIGVRLHRDGARAVLSVADTGAGIDAALLPHVFDRFRQGDAPRARGEGGLGLGLAIVRHLVALHEGTVTVESAGRGLGTTFTVRLPLIATPRAAAKSLPERDAVARGERALQGVRVLAVDDHPDSREIVRVALSREGAEVTTAACVDEALAALDQAAIDVLVSDVGMPGADGLTLVARLRERERAAGRRRLVAIALTAYAGRDDRARALAAGFDQHVAKPVDPDTLADAVAATLRRAS
jgi:PAS domain S-box-containing protein